MKQLQKNNLIDRLIHKLNIKNALIAATISTAKTGQIIKLEVIRFKKKHNLANPAYLRAEFNQILTPISTLK